MIRKSKRCISLLLVLVLLVGMVPAAYATETDTESTSPEETISEATEATNPTEPTEPTNPPEDAVDEDLSAISETNNFALMSIGSTQGSIMLFDYADNGNYTTVLNSQVSCSYKPNGTGTTRTAYIKNLGWHFARYGGVAHPDEPLYCIEPWRSYGASTSGNTVDRDVTLDGSGSTSGSNVWYALPSARREAIGLILLYSNQMWNHSVSVTTTKKDSNPNVPLRIATQFLIYEIVCGLRDPDTFERNYSNECGTSGDVFYNAGAASVSGFTSNYNSLVSSIQSAKQIPSFTSSSSGSAPTITLKGEETSVTDTNGVLSNWNFTDGNGAEFYKSGNTLYITQTGTISESTVFRATRNLPSAASSTYSLWYMTGSSYQTTISLASPSNSNLNAYFKLKAVPQTGNISLTKTTEDGKNLSSWRFGIYSNSGCTNLVSGPHTTNSSGRITVTDATELARAREQAIAYNASIKPGTMGEAYSPNAMLEASKDYVNQLNVDGNGIMGYIEIPKIGVDLPIYHGTESETLDKGVGHLLGSSLPIGGENTHAILSGHSGMASQKMFTDLEQLREGDVFYLRVLDEMLAYQVKAILTVQPHDTAFLGVVPGEDLCTLVTCTPTGVNTHRLLVRGTRIPYEEAVAVEEETAKQEEESSSHWEDQYWLGIRLGLVAMICIVLLLNVVLMVKKQKHAKGTIAERKSRPLKKKGGRYVRK